MIKYVLKYRRRKQYPIGGKKANLSEPSNLQLLEWRFRVFCKNKRAQLAQSWFIVVFIILMLGTSEVNLYWSIRSIYYTSTRTSFIFDDIVIKRFTRIIWYAKELYYDLKNNIVMDNRTKIKNSYWFVKLIIFYCGINYKPRTMFIFYFRL